MKKQWFVSLVFTLLTGVVLHAQAGILKEHLKMKSNLLGKDVTYSVYLPPDYGSSNRSYPVLYLLHGFSDDDTGWTQFGEAHLIADRALAEGRTAPMIIVMPDAGLSWYVNSEDGSLPWEDFFIQEFIPNVEKGFRIRAKKEFRAVAGLSMGGYGSLLMATKHPDMFAACAPLSAAVFLDEEMNDQTVDGWNNFFQVPFGKTTAVADRLDAHYRENSIYNIIKKGPVEPLRSIQYYIDCGDKDFLIKGNMALHSLMIDQEIPHEFRVREGAHSWSYWRSALPSVLAFVGAVFHR